MSTCGATKPFHFSTDDVPAQQRAEAARGMHGIRPNSLVCLSMLCRSPGTGCRFDRYSCAGAEGLGLERTETWTKAPCSLSFGPAKPAYRSWAENTDDARERRPRILPLSTDDMPPHERAAAVREMHERCTLPIKPEPVEPLADQPMRININQRLGSGRLKPWKDPRCLREFAPFRRRGSKPLGQTSCASR